MRDVFFGEEMILGTGDLFFESEVCEFREGVGCYSSWYFEFILFCLF